MNPRNIFLDFDGTVVEHAYPQIGNSNPLALEVIKKLQDNGHLLILNTMRVHFDDGSLQASLDYLNKHPAVSGIKIIRYTSSKIHPKPWHKEKLKLADDIFIDDLALDVPLIDTREHGPMVNWKEVEKQLIEAGLLPG